LDQNTHEPLEEDDDDDEDAEAPREPSVAQGDVALDGWKGF
jgi:hypothetical protein